VVYEILCGLCDLCGWIKISLDTKHSLWYNIHLTMRK